MKPAVPRLRMFAGPNGSGKTTLKRKLIDEYGAAFLGIDINPDDIEARIATSGTLDLRSFGVQLDHDSVIHFFESSTLLTAKGLQAEAGKIAWRDGVIDFSQIAMNSYYASACAALIRQQLIVQRESFALETVMSSRDKLELLDTALSEGFRTYLYFVATSDPDQSVARVEYRVAEGGHDVPPEKIISRYTRSLENLSGAIRLSNRAYVFDNSGAEPELIAEITDGTEIKLHTHTAREWFQTYVLNRIPGKE